MNLQWALSALGEEVKVGTGPDGKVANTVMSLLSLSVASRCFSVFVNR